MSRPVSFSYIDPLDAIWLACAKAMGLRVVRSPDSYASTDGKGTLSLSDAAGMDADDCLAQMILHEICHSMVQGTQSFGWVDWGLDNEGVIDDEREHACLRLQAALLEPLGLRQTLGPTTDFREYYDALPSDPFEERNEKERESITRARSAWARRYRRPYREHLEVALQATARVLHETARALQTNATDKARDRAPLDSASLYSTLLPESEKHAVGFPLHPDPDSKKTCGECAWAFRGGPGKAVLRCRQAKGARISPGHEACERHESSFDCLGCGACCREAYDTVEVSARDAAKKFHLDMMVERTGGLDMKRAGSRCACLLGGVPLAPPTPAIHGGDEAADAGAKVAPLAMPGGAPFTCKIYETRPRTCRDFTIFSENCLDARRTVGLSR